MSLAQHMCHTHAIRIIHINIQKNEGWFLNSFLIASKKLFSGQKGFYCNFLIQMRKILLQMMMQPQQIAPGIIADINCHLYINPLPLLCSLYTQCFSLSFIYGQCSLYIITFLSCTVN